MSYKMIVSDVDGTLVDDKKLISDKNLTYIRNIIDQGIIFVIATGRMYPSAMEIASRIDREIPIIATNGSIVSQNNKIIKSYPLELGKLTKIKESLTDDKITLFFYGQDSFYMTADSEENFNKVYKSPQFKYNKYIFNSVDDLENESIYKAFYYSEYQSSLENLRRSLKSIDNINITSSFKSNVEVSDLNASKGNGVKSLADKFNIKMDEIIAIGDNHNDISMVEKVGLGVAVDNACDQLKEVADVITVSNNDSPLAKIIEDYIL